MINAGGAVTSSVASLTVLPTNSLATVAGAYNGLFFQTNADGTPAVTEATAGFLGNCVVASNGLFSAKIYVGGLSYSLAGVFSGSGNATVTIPRPGTGLSNLTAVLQLDLTNGTQEITGAMSAWPPATPGHPRWWLIWPRTRSPDRRARICGVSRIVRQFSHRLRRGERYRYQ